MRGIMRRDYKAYKKVGKIKESISENLELSIPKAVYASPGVINHIKKVMVKVFLTKTVININYSSNAKQDYMESVLKMRDIVLQLERVSM